MIMLKETQCTCQMLEHTLLHACCSIKPKRRVTRIIFSSTVSAHKNHPNLFVICSIFFLHPHFCDSLILNHSAGESFQNLMSIKSPERLRFIYLKRIQSQRQSFNGTRVTSTPFSCTDIVLSRSVFMCNVNRFVAKIPYSFTSLHMEISDGQPMIYLL